MSVRSPFSARRALVAAVFVAVLVAVLVAGPASVPARSAESSTPPSALRVAPAFVVALDPGHGGSNLGAAADGLLEKDVTLALARRVRARLAAISGVRVVLCRDADVLVAIRARARCAAEAHAQLFVSLHANATPVGVAPGSQRGYELYVLPPEDVEDDAALTALSAPGAAGVWAAHLVHRAGARSIAAAGALDRRLGEALGRTRGRGVRENGAALDVLRGAGAAAVLVELGFLDSAEDRAGLVSPEGQERLAAALGSAILDVAGHSVAAAAR